MKDLVPWGNNWAPMRELRREVNRLFDSVWNETTDRIATAMGWSPLVDIKETADAFEVHAELPGIDKADIAIQMTGNTLTLSGERRRQDEGANENYHRVERSFGRFSRSFSFPGDVDPGKIDAALDRGVLVITIPKREETKPKPIEIKVK